MLFIVSQGEAFVLLTMFQGVPSAIAITRERKPESLKRKQRLIAIHLL